MYVITGGAGFIGSNVAYALEAKGAGPLVIVDWLGVDDKWRNIAKRTLYDIVAPENIDGFLHENAHDVTAIVHMGAISATTERDADLIVDTNFRLSRDLWRFCAATGTPFIYASSAATYGDGTDGFDDDMSATALGALSPLNAYGWSKLLFRRGRRSGPGFGSSMYMGPTNTIRAGCRAWSRRFNRSPQKTPPANCSNHIIRITLMAANCAILSRLMIAPT